MPQLSDLAIRAAKPSAASFTLWDEAIKGFGCRIYPGGAKTFIVLIGPGRRQSIGRYPIITLADARTEARRILAEKTLGKVRPTHTAFEEAREDFLKDCEKRLRPLTVKLYRRHLSVHFPFGRKSVGDITPREIVQRLNALNDRPSEKEHASRIGRTFFAWCIGQQLIERSPMETIAKPAPRPSRKHVLSDEELKAVYMTALSGKTTFHHFVAILTLLALRRTECAHLEWAFFHDGILTIPGTLTKNHNDHVIPYGKAVEAVLEDIPIISTTYLFPAARTTKGAPVMTGFSERKRDFDAECGVTGWTHHDMRRTFSTRLADMDVAPHITERLLNHISGEVSGVAAIYNQSRYMRPMREAVEKWELYLHSLLAPQSVG